MRAQPDLMFRMPVDNHGPLMDSSMVCGIVKLIKNKVPTKNVTESMMNAAFVPQMDTTTPPNMAPMQSAVDHDAASKALAVARSSSATTLGNAARSAVM